MVNFNWLNCFFLGGMFAYGLVLAIAFANIFAHFG